MDNCISYNKVTLALLLIGYFVFYFEVVALSVLAPEMIKDTKINLTKDRIGMIIFVSAFVRMFEKFFSGTLVDTYNPKILYLVSGLLKHIFVIAFAFSNSYGYFLLFWALNEGMWGPAWPATLKIISNWFDDSNIGSALGILSLSYLFGDALIRIILGIFIMYGYTWRHILIFCAGLGISYLFVLLIFLKNNPHDKFIWELCKKNEHVEIIDHDFSDREELKEPKTCKYVWDTQWKPLISRVSFWLLFFTVVIMSLARYTLFYWSPMYLVSQNTSDYVAAYGSMIFPLFGGFGAIIIGILNDKMNTDFKKNIVMFVFFICSTISIFFIWLIADKMWTTVVTTLVMYGLIGFFLLGAYTLPGGVMAIRFGKESCANCSSLLEFGGSISLALSGLMSQIFSKNNDWTMVWFICTLFYLIFSLFFDIELLITDFG